MDEGKLDSPQNRVLNLMVLAGFLELTFELVTGCTSFFKRMNISASTTEFKSYLVIPRNNLPIMKNGRHQEKNAESQVGLPRFPD